MSGYLISLLFTVPSAFGVLSQTDRVSAKIAMQNVQEKKAIVVDVREASEIKTGMITDAKIFPTSKLNTPEWDKFVQTLPKDKEIYTYCAVGGRADRVAKDLRAKGLKAHGTGGFFDWLEAGAKSTVK